MNKTGHQEIYGETIAKIEFYEQGFNPYSRFLDVDKVDLVLRRREGGRIVYREVQVKYGRLYRCDRGWERELFDVTSWRFFGRDEFADHRTNLWVAYILVHDDRRYEGDIFIFPSRVFHELVGAAIAVGDGSKRKMYISKARSDGRWYLRTSKKFLALGPETVRSVEEYRRRFSL